MKRIVVSGAVLALAIGGVQAATAAPSVYKVTGGGQITEFVVPGEGDEEDTVTPLSQGAGDTIAFSAQQLTEGEMADGSNAKGQFQYVDRIQDAETGKGTGKGQEVIHGTVSCVVVYSYPGSEEGGYAVIGGENREGTEKFRIEVTDGSATGSGADMIAVRRGADAATEDGSLCDDREPAEGLALGRGNVKIHKNGAPAEEAPAEETEAGTTAKGKRNA